MTILTAGGSFAEAYQSQFKAKVVSRRELPEHAYLEKLSRADTVIHNASSINADLLETYIARNFDYTRYLLASLQKVNPKAHVIFLSSMSILSNNNDAKYAKVQTMTDYAYSKYLAETFCLKSNPPKLSCVRFSTLFYQNPDKDGLSKLVHDAVTTKKVKIYNGGEARRNFMPIDIAAQYVHKLVKAGNGDRQTYNIAAPASVSFADIISLLKNFVPDLAVMDQTAPSGPHILSEFSQDSIAALGAIDFSLEAYIKDYVKRLSV
jgi:nucleoside-diphosphate-sugar epimerase